ncbi:MAG: 4-alpha-glucanotransferase [Prevotella sp.]|nr:4-alpha-glucanotransferase [Prevotella sp.]
MKIIFNIAYRTVFGEELVLNAAGKASDGSALTTPYRMTTDDGEHWRYEMNLKKGQEPAVIDYSYSVDRDGTERRHEWTTVMHRLELNVAKAVRYVVFDQWSDIPDDAYSYSSAFTGCLNNRLPKTFPAVSSAKTVRLRVRAPQLRKGEQLAIVGSSQRLGLWNPAKALPMTEHNYNEWVVDLPAEAFEAHATEYKFIIRSAGIVWEEGPNRAFVPQPMQAGEVTVCDLCQPRFSVADTRLAGTLVPVFSLRTKGSFGVGDFGDLKTMIDYVAQTGQRVLQVLPINDTTTTHTWTDSYPYSCISIFALHPQYVDFRQLPKLKDENLRKKYETLRKQLNDLPQIDYEKVNQAKDEMLRLLFEQEGRHMMASAQFKQFFSETQQWLVPYAYYCYLRDKGQLDGHPQWQEADRKTLTNTRTRIYKEVSFYYFVQFVLDTQMQTAHAYARLRNVVLKGDIPIGVSRHGCDVWMEPKYFNMNGQAGAPPDDFSANGQNWGFPTYNWDEMIKDGCQWWVRRFQNMSRYFDAYRIDHVLGFFRIWEIPIDSVYGLTGQFSPALGMTREEIEAYGLHFQEELFTQPFIAEWTLDRIFGDRKEEVKAHFVNHWHDDIYRMKPEYDTQRKIEKTLEPSDFRDGLMALVSNVLFVRDRKDANKFHPRISAQQDFMYEALWDSDKAAFNKLYNDYFYRRNNQFWYREAMKKLPRLVQATRMLVCAEDLGMVPDCVAWVMQELRILSLEIQSMPKDPKVRFGYLERNPYRSVSTISSHDMPTLRQWWDEDFSRTQDYYNSMLGQQGAAPHPLPGWLARTILEQHLKSPSMLCILSIQDWLAIDEHLRLEDADAERINIPANPRHYWRYRMHVNIEDLMQNKDFTATVSKLIADSGR